MLSNEFESRAQGRIGTVLRGKYRLERILGVGGMAVVYSATHRNQKQFAVKMLHPELSIREDIRTRFLREGYAANSVKHPGAVAVLDDDVADDGAAFLVMELLEGGGLEQLWERLQMRLPLFATLAIAHQLLDVLAAAHAKAIVHRDIKPANLFLLYDGTLKVLDFGIARVRDMAVGGLQATGSGLLLGTPAFMAPEQALAKSSEIDGQTDLWAVGATLFSFLSGVNVHDGDNAPQVMVKTATSQARSLASVTQGIPPAVVRVVDRAIAFEKSARWSSAVEMRDAVRDVCRATFGEDVSKAPLVSLFGSCGITLPGPHSFASPPSGAFSDRISAAPVVSSTSPAANSVGSPGSTLGMRPTVSSSGEISAVDPGRGPGAVGAQLRSSTSEPVSSDAPSRAAVRRRLWPIVLLSVLGVGGVGFAASRLVGSPTEAAGAPGTTRANASTTTARAPDPPPAPASASADPEPPSAAPPPPSPPAPSASLTASAPPRPGQGPSSAERPRPPPAADSTGKAGCKKTTVSYTDKDGNVRFKQVCQ